MTDLISEQDETIETPRLQRKHWLALVAVFAVIELIWLYSILT